MPSLSDSIKRYRERASVSQNALARKIGVNPAYINRLEKWGKGTHNRNLIENVAAALNLSSFESDQLLAEAGHLPNALSKLGSGDETLLIVADILSDESIPDKDKEAFRLHVKLASKPWRTVEI